MRSAVTLLLASLTLVAASPHAHPQGAPSSVDPVPLPTPIVVDPTISVPLSTSLNVPTTPPVPTLLPTLSVPVNLSSSRSTRHHFSHWEPIPIFSSACNCPSLATVQYPCWATDALQRCNFEELHSFICWTSAARGCPTPTRQCDQFYSPTPITGKHPCDLGHNTGSVEPGDTTVYITETSYVTFVPTAVLTAAPSASPTAPPLRRWQDMAWSPEYYGVRK